MIWQCNTKFKNNKKCGTPYIYKILYKEAFMEIFNSIFKNKSEILHGYESIIQALTDTSKLDRECAEIQNEMEIVTEVLRKYVDENAYSALNQAEYEKRYNDLAECYEVIRKKITEINDKRLERTAEREGIEEFKDIRKEFCYFNRV